MYKLLLVIIMATLTAGSTAKSTGTSSMSAAEILQHTAKTYASCKSYRDTGTVTGVIPVGGKTYNTALRFETAFSRPDRFRFEYKFQ